MIPSTWVETFLRISPSTTGWLGFCYEKKGATSINRNHTINIGHQNLAASIAPHMLYQLAQVEQRQPVVVFEPNILRFPWEQLNEVFFFFLSTGDHVFVPLAVGGAHLVLTLG
jgi:hypothetical protein